jgi:hypothetical protein
VNAAEQIADAYLDAAYSNLTARTKRAARFERGKSYGLLLSLEIVCDGMEGATRLIEQRHPDHRRGRGYNIETLLYDFWGLDRRIVVEP